MTDTVANNRRIAKNTLFLSLRMVLVLGLTLYTTRIVLKELGVLNYGIYNVVCGFVSMFAFLNTSMSNGIQRFFNFELGKNREDGANKVYNTAIFIQLVLSGILILAAESFGVWYINYVMSIPTERLFAANWIFQLSLLSLLFVVMQAPFTAAVMAHEKMNFYAILGVFDAVLKIIIACVIHLFKGDGLIVYGVLMMLISMINFVLYYIYCKRHFSEIRRTKSPCKDLFKSMLGFSGWNIFGSFSGIMNQQGINMIMNVFFGPVVNAARGIAVQVNSGIQSFVNNIVIPARPQIVQSYAIGNKKRTINLAYSISKISCYCLYLMALPMIYCIDWVLYVWLGKNVPENTDIFVVITILTSLIGNLNSSVSAVVHATGKMKLYQVSTSLSSLLALPLSYIGLKNGLPAVSALWMAFFTMVLAQSVAVVVLKKLVGISIVGYLREVILPIITVILSTFWIPYIIVGNRLDGWLEFIAVTGISLVSGCAAILAFGLDKKEKQFVNNIINLLKSKI